MWASSGRPDRLLSNHIELPPLGADSRLMPYVDCSTQRRTRTYYMGEVLLLPDCQVPFPFLCRRRSCPCHLLSPSCSNIPLTNTLSLSAKKTIHQNGRHPTNPPPDPAPRQQRHGLGLRVHNNNHLHLPHPDDLDLNPLPCSDTNPNSTQHSPPPPPLEQPPSPNPPRHPNPKPNLPPPPRRLAARPLPATRRPDAGVVPATKPTPASTPTPKPTRNAPSGRRADPRLPKLDPHRLPRLPWPAQLRVGDVSGKGSAGAGGCPGEGAWELGGVCCFACCVCFWDRGRLWRGGRGVLRVDVY